ncbi:hypothetical protein HID58_087365 [Brassica napus]|uniref:Uncharacterized protein n=1 Tax=Brassica napus TaxID=3708 RepID=A0ABQ7XT56_BRANA|nr:hypothetical protein HID58_087365 [Brassica napus]
MELLKNPTEITISCIERGEMSLDILMIEKNFTFSKLMKKGILIVEPVRLSVKNDEQLIKRKRKAIFININKKV